MWLPGIFSYITAVPSLPTDVRAILINCSNTIVVSWTPPSGGTPPTGYIIYYEATSGGADVGSATVSGASTSEVTITGRASGVYTVRIVTLSDQLPSNCSTVIETIHGEYTIEENCSVNGSTIQCMCVVSAILIKSRYHLLTSSLPILVTQGLYFGGSRVVNHGIVALDQIMNTASTALLCVIPAADCCTVAGSGDWFSPSGSVVTTSTASATYQVKGNCSVDLRRSSGGMVVVGASQGIYHCDIRLSAGAAHTSFYVGVYLAGSGMNTYQ